MVTIAPYGSWRSPITSEMTASGSMRLGHLMADGDDIYWVEMRPEESGRYVVVQYSKSCGIIERTPVPHNARTRVHEYGGGAYTVWNQAVYFTNYKDQLIYKQEHNGELEKISTNTAHRHADFVFDKKRDRLLCVREDHSDKSSEALNIIVSINLKDNESKVLLQGNDFYSSPRQSPDGSKLAWLTWNHPYMPWDGCELWLAEMDERGRIGSKKLVAGGSNESIVQPEWSPDGELFFVSDRSGWWNLYRLKGDDVEAIFSMDAEFGGPHWQFAVKYYAFESPTSVICIYFQNGIRRLAKINLIKKKLETFQTPYTDFNHLMVVNRDAYFVAGSPTKTPEVVHLNLKNLDIGVLKKSDERDIDKRYISVPEPIEFTTKGGLRAHAIYYSPRNKEYQAPEGVLPPLIVISHGGPTGATTTTLSLGIQYWTTRGFAVVDVNYGGSTGYGREYMRRLIGQWGVVDVDDCVNAAKHLVNQGLVDSERLAIRGGSAGGYTTMSALAFRDLFKAGASYYGLSDLEVFVEDTHKFESKYLHSLIGPYPERRDLYRKRSAINYLNQIKAPMIIFQGLEDKIVPPNQAELIVDALNANGLPVAYIPFEEEQHGFRKAENIKRSLDAELYFYSKIFGFTPADELEPVAISNLCARYEANTQIKPDMCKHKNR